MTNWSTGSKPVLENSRMNFCEDNAIFCSVMIVDVYSFLYYFGLHL